MIYMTIEVPVESGVVEMTRPGVAMHSHTCPAQATRELLRNRHRVTNIVGWVGARLKSVLALF